MWRRVAKMLEHMDPLVSIILMTHNRENYVRDALFGVLNQSYELLQIIIVDDCSTDGTWSIVRNEIESYQRGGGFHKDILIHRHEHNVGVAKNFEFALTLARGDLLVPAADDDISMPNRVERIVDAWKTNHSATVFCHGAYRIDSHGKRYYEKVLRTEALFPLGAMMAYSARVYKEFGPIKETGAWEDDVFARRAQMLGECVQIEEPLIFYRIGSDGMSSGGDEARKRRSRVAMGCLLSARQSRKDLEWCRKTIGEWKYEQILKDIILYEKKYQAECDMYNAPSWILRFKAFNTLCKINKVSRLGRLNGFTQTMLPGWAAKCLTPIGFIAKRVLGQH